MNLEIFDIRSVGEGRYTIALRVSGKASSYVLTLSEDPILGLSAPESFWALLQGEKDAAREVLAFVATFHKTGSVIVPKQLTLKGEHTDTSLEDLPWVSRTAAWHLSSESVDWGLKHLSTRGNNTLFPLPFEHKVLLERIDEFSKQVQEINICRHQVRDFRQLWVPKSPAGRRYATQLDPLDAVVLTAIAYELGETIEASRIPSEDEIVFSWRFSPTADGSIWDKHRSYRAFQERILETLRQDEDAIVIETDIASFYHSIELSLIASNLERIGVKRKYVETLKTILGSMKIDGLPVGPSFSALFAEAVLTPIDLHLLSAGAKFVRFNDDYRFFCRSEVEAQSRLESLADALLRTTGMVLQSEKTRISSAEDYLSRTQSNWLARLYSVDSDEEDDGTRTLLKSARVVLEKSIDDSHGAYVDLCRKAFNALPLEEKKLVMPQILDQLARVWVIAPQVSKSLEALLDKSQGGEDLLTLVLERLANRSPDLQDYAATWILHAFWRKEWKGKESLANLDSKLTPAQTAARRELLIALRQTPDAPAIAFDAADPWQHRARVWATGQKDERLIPLQSEERVEWMNSLFNALVTTELND